jgi:hypothetical protein
MSLRVRLALIIASAAVLTACSTENKYERAAESVTKAIMSDDPAALQKQFAPSVQITRVRVASYADELDAQGKLLSVKERPQCTPGYHCVVVQFEKHTYVERILLDNKGQVVSWAFHMAQPSAGR